MDENDAPPAGRVRRRRAPRGGRAGSVHWSAKVAKRICERVAAGELLYAVCREPGMPTPQSVRLWARDKPDFAEALALARRAGGRPSHSGGGVWSYCAETGEEIFERLCEGESLTAIGKDPTMPCLSTIFYWRRRIPAFEEQVQVAKRIQAERFCDLGWELATEATPETAYLTHVRLSQLRWTAGVMAPRVFRIKTVEPQTPPEPLTVLVRHFRIETDPATGEQKVVAYCPNPETGEVEREDAPGWRPPAGAVRLPGG
ncbi:hypothetical protein DJ021_09915 [Phenylobacterium hankyongense]|uniref:Uncharacterized protein n=1 Tax=Phenylobacterium hankyongense TaxID=1813876 RepID=A0A328AZM6_9CAUL|nr:hypothetical protein [Phenylobacterium hankyongense]RAK60099.1 hypothetical protein DJ021_09915 [Phenylobacterium hankyongense]